MLVVRLVRLAARHPSDCVALIGVALIGVALIGFPDRAWRQPVAAGRRFAGHLLRQAVRDRNDWDDVLGRRSVFLEASLGVCPFVVLKKNESHDCGACDSLKNISIIENALVDR